MVCFLVSQRRKFSCSCQTRSKNSASSRPLTTATVTRSRICRSSSTGRTRSAPENLRASRAISLEGDETTTDSRRSEKEVKRAQRTQKIVCKERKSTASQSGDGAFSSLPLEGKARAHSPAQGKASSALPVLRRVTAKRKNVHGRVLPCTFRVRWGFPGLALRRVSCAGRGPGSGCAAARGRGPGAGCRRHSPGRGSAAGCAGRRLRLP